MKYISFLILGIFLISCVSAQVISIEPSSLEDLNLYAGETFIQNITIKTEENSLVYLDYDISNNQYDLEGFLINLPQLIIVEKEIVIPIEISTVPNYKPDSFIITIMASTNKSVVEHYRGSGRTRRVYVENKTTETIILEKNKTVEEDSHGCKINEGYAWCEPKQKCIKVSEEECKEIEAPGKGIYVFIAILLSFILLAVISILIRIIKKKSEKQVTTG